MQKNTKKTARADENEGLDEKFEFLRNFWGGEIHASPCTEGWHSKLNK